jgi:hypothetical protein
MRSIGVFPSGGGVSSCSGFTVSFFLMAVSLAAYAASIKRHVVAKSDAVSSL